MKKAASILMSLLLTVSVSTNAFAALNKVNEPSPVQNTKISGEVKLNDSNTIVSKVLTFEEIAQDYAKSEKVSISEAKNIFVQDILKTDANINSLAEAKAAVASIAYRTVYNQFTVTSVYKPSVKFYLQTNETGVEWDWSIRAVLNTSMNRLYNGIVKEFGGTVYVNLQNNFTIYYDVEGTWYNTGTTTFDTGISVGLGKAATWGANVSNATSYYSYSSFNRIFYPLNY